MNTSCNSCIFLTNNNCNLGKLKEYEDHGLELIQHNGFPMIKNIKCPFKRDASWKKNNYDNVHNKSKDEIEDFLIKENGFPFSAFIYEQNDINIELAVDDLLSLHHPPKYVYITFKYMHQDESLLTRLSQKLEEKNIKYKLVINLDEELDNFYDSFLAFRLNIKTPFVSIHFGNAIIPRSITTKLSYEIQKNLLSFPYADTENKQFVFFPRLILEEYIIEEGPLFIERIFQTQCRNYQF